MSGRRHIVLFDQERRLLEAITDCRQRGVAVLDAHSPYPIHGIDELLDIPRSKLTLVCFFGGLAGLSLGFLFQYWSSATNWPLNVGGKPFDSLSAFVPVAFELTVLFGGLATALMLIVRSRLWPGKKSFRSIERVTDDQFALVIEENDASLSPDELPDLFRRHGAVRTYVEEDE